jgi:hypothetical protein
VEAIGQCFEIAGASIPPLPAPDLEPFFESAPAMPSPDVAEWLDRLTRERDEARAEGDQLRQEACALRYELEGYRSVVAQLSQSAEKLTRVRAERNQLKVERDMLGREAAESKARLLALQLTLVEAEAELDDCRARARAAWEQRRQGDPDGADSPIDDGPSQFEFHVEGWSESPASASGPSEDSDGNDTPRE